MQKKPEQKIIAIVLLCAFLALIIAFAVIWHVKFKDSEIANNKEANAAPAEIEPEPEPATVKVSELSCVMYSAMPALTVRDTPSSEGVVVSTLAAGEEITVTGVCENGWYRIDNQNGEGYCFGKYLSENKETAPVINTKASIPYYITVNRTQNEVVVYQKDAAGEFTVPFKAMVCSVGKDDATPLGTYDISDKFVWAYLSGDVCGQYATRITGPYLFHSVPYFTENKGDLEYEEYNKLGEAASLGCVRMAVIDVKWVYENCPEGTTVTVYDSEQPEPLPRPVPIKIDPDDERRGWDPTDPDPKNPWK